MALAEKSDRDIEREMCRERFRHVFLQAAGSSPEIAFRSIDLNRNGVLSLQEFTDGVKRLCVQWQEATGKSTVKELFKLFSNKEGVITLEDLFPDSKQEMMLPNRMSTPDFWNHWCKSNPNLETKNRGAKWQPDADEELQELFRATEARQEVTDRKRWMSQTIRRMKSQGRSDARCRELCASHLPRGTGTRDQEYVPAFTEADVKVCRRTYADGFSGPLRNIQKQVHAMKEQRLDLHNYSLELRRMQQRNTRCRMQKAMEHRRNVDGPDIPEDILDVEDEDDEEGQAVFGQALKEMFGKGTSSA
jgi:hypothetical protein